MFGFPTLAPSTELMAQGQAAVTETEWKRFDPRPLKRR